MLLVQLLDVLEQSDDSVVHETSLRMLSSSNHGVCLARSRGSISKDGPIVTVENGGAQTPARCVEHFVLRSSFVQHLVKLKFLAHSRMMPFGTHAEATCVSTFVPRIK